MKTFTYPQKKWVLTGALLAVLGLNVSFNSHKYGIAQSADFSSLSEPTKLNTPDGTISVIYIAESESKVRAIIPKKTTHGDFCTSNSCGVDDVILSVKNKTDIDELNVALLKALEEDKKLGKKVTQPEAIANEKEKVVGVQNPEKAKQDGDIEEEIEKKLASILKRCERNDAQIDQLSCLTDELATAMQKFSKKSNSAVVFQRFVRDEVLTRVVGTINDSRRAYVLAKKSQVDMDARQQYWESDLQYEDASDMRKNSLLAVEALLSKTPKNYESVRKLLVSAETTLIREEARAIQQLRKDAESMQSTNIAGATSLKWDAQFRTEDLQNLQKGFTKINGIAFDYAQRSQNMDGNLQSVYTNYFTNSTMPIINGMIMNPQTYVVPVVQEDGSVIPTPVTGVPVFAPRINAPGRGTTAPQVQTSTTATTQPVAISSRVGTTAAPVTGTNMSADLPGVRGGTNTITFGDVSNASDEALRLRTQLRGQ